MKRKLLSILALLCLTVASAWAKTVTFTITSEDLMGAMGGFITKDGVIVSASMIDMDRISGPGSFSTSEGNFTKIVITPEMVNIEGEGWDRNTWEGTPSSTVPFEGTIDGMGDDIMIECTIETEIPLSLSPNTPQTFRVDEIVAFTANTDKDVKWSVGGTDASAIALYSDAGCTESVGTGETSTKTVYAKGVSVGSATVTVTTSDDEETASCDVTVKGPKWNGGTHTAIDDESLGAIEVTADATLTINEGVTVTVDGDINVTSGTLTVNGLGTLVVNGAITVTDDATLTINEGVTVTVDGGIDVTSGTLTVNGLGTLVVNGANTGPGDGNAAISGNIIVQGATVMATGGQGGMGITVNSAGYPGANGGAAFSGAVTIYSGNIWATGGKGGQGGYALYSDNTSGDGGTGGAAFSSTSTLTYYGGNVAANGGAGGDSGVVIKGATRGSAGEPGNAFASNSVTLENTPTTLTGGGSNITIEANPTVTDYRTVSITGVAGIYFVTANQADGASWSTFYSNEGNYQASEGTQVFAVNLTGTTITMTEISDRIVVSGQGVVLKSTSGNITMTRTNVTPAADFSGNSLMGTMTSITNPGNAYVLNKTDENGIGFYRLSDSGTIGANKAYLTYSGDLAREFFLFDEATGIEAIENGELTIDNVVYDLQGRRVAQPAKGLYIVNGKKYIKK